MFDATVENLANDRVIKYAITYDGSPISYAKVLKGWARSASFRSFFTKLLADCPFSAYRWETPVLMRSTFQRPFEFVLLDSSGFIRRRSDAQTYDDYFTDDDANEGVVAFENLGKDATLVVPSPRTDHKNYGHLAAFVRGAPQTQLDAFWRVVSETVTRQISDKPIWLSTAGGGVAWLHVRLDSRPKYYGYAPYKTLE